MLDLFSLKAAVLALGYLSEDEFDSYVKAEKMASPTPPPSCLYHLQVNGFSKKKKMV